MGGRGWDGNRTAGDTLEMSDGPFLVTPEVVSESEWWRRDEVVSVQGWTILGTADTDTGLVGATATGNNLCWWT